MGQKTQPIGFRLGINRTWDSRWFGGKSYADLLHQDIGLRKYLFEKLKSAAVSKIVIERPAGRARISIYAGRPGLVIGKKGQDIETLKQTLGKQIGAEVSLNIIEVRKPELDAKLVADGIAQQLEKRVAFRRAMKRAMQSAMRLNAKGIKVMLSGRLAGNEIARTEWLREGSIPAHTLRAEIDYGFSEALTTYGLIGIKVWICKGEVYGKRDLSPNLGMTNKKSRNKK